ncbi:hypothetical protein KIN20_026998 [Parelaphostrongylus tenuis]|uniref:Uncharacterized protein n=1 Tax=Parelaphostrongylus tenuis TaxID=148309 RepID=A0AAD5QYR3_PARTN|nr:hypothetical protein KIN20_026998 [Parelaphostrongylus tenuis]
MELVRSRSYDLSELVSQILGEVRENVYADEMSAKFSSSQQLLSLIQWSWIDPWLSLRVVSQLNALPLAVQITNIVGGVMVGVCVCDSPMLPYPLPGVFSQSGNELTYFTVWAFDTHRIACRDFNV